MKKIVVVIPHSHTWFWTQTCLASLQRNPPKAEGYEVCIVVVDNSPWSPAIRGVTDTDLGMTVGFGPKIRVIENYKSNKFHASALDCVVEKLDFDLMMALETDVLVLRPTWLQWFVDQLKHTDYAVGHWHHEQFVNPSCTLYRGRALRTMLEWCKPDSMHRDESRAPQNELRWGVEFSKTAPLDSNLIPSVLSDPRDLQAAIKGFKEWVGGPFAEKRGWPKGTILKEMPSGQLKGPGWYEPGQQLHHWAVEAGYTYTVCPTMTTEVNNVPVQTLYNSSMPDPLHQLEAAELFCNAETVHMWGGTRALDILKHEVTCSFVKKCTPTWLAREARFWRAIVPQDVQKQTLDVIRKYGWHYRGQGSDHITDRDREAAQFVKSCYKEGGVIW